MNPLSKTKNLKIARHPLEVGIGTGGSPVRSARPRRAGRAIATGSATEQAPVQGFTALTSFLEISRRGPFPRGKGEKPPLPCKPRRVVFGRLATLQFDHGV